MSDTAKSWTINKAPRFTSLLGDKTKKAESAEHIIEFPGGAVAVCRVSDDEYWAHIICNTGQSIDDCEGLCASSADVVDSRIQDQHGVHSLPCDERSISQIAVRIRRNRGTT
jgi:hypothetical protein